MPEELCILKYLKEISELNTKDLLDTKIPFYLCYKIPFPIM
jgi:hypothetical protein